MVDVAVIGGGPSGLLTAILASKNKNVIILEKQSKVGKKILVTGNGRCNLTNIDLSIKYYNSNNMELVLKYLTKLNFIDTIKLFKELGLLTRVENGNVYPYSNQATSVLDILRINLKKNNVEEICDFETINIKKFDSYYKIISKDKKEIDAKKVVISTGGKSYFPFDKDSSGYELLKMLGHNITNLYPSLTGIYSDNKNLKNLKGIRVKSKATLLIADKKVKSEIGEVLFNEKGLSGICIFNLSQMITTNLDKNIEVSLDIVNDYSKEEMFNLIKEKASKNITIEELLIGIINKNIALALLKELNYKNLNSNELSDNDIELIINKMKDWKFKIIGIKNFNEAQVTSGGVSLEEFDDNLESKISKGIYAAGEVLDVDGICGGYNLQWAWTSAYIVGKSIENDKSN